MIQWEEAKDMPYPVYKHVFWTRLLNWWLRYAPDHPEQKEFVEARIKVATDMLAIWP